jgi:hypothetical protein
MLLAPSVAALFKWRQFEPEMILLAVGWYLRFSLSYRNVEELLAERGLHADHVTESTFSFILGSLATIADYEAIHMIRKGQACCTGRVRRSVYCTASFSGCSRRRTELPIIYHLRRLSPRLQTCNTAISSASQRSSSANVSEAAVSDLYSPFCLTLETSYLEEDGLAPSLPTVSNLKCRQVLKVWVPVTTAGFIDRGISKITFAIAT